MEKCNERPYSKPALVAGSSLHREAGPDYPSVLLFFLWHTSDEILDNYTHFWSDFIVFFRAEIENFTVSEYGGQMWILKSHFTLRFVLSLS